MALERTPARAKHRRSAENEAHELGDSDRYLSQSSMLDSREVETMVRHDTHPAATQRDRRTGARHRVTRESRAVLLNASGASFQRPENAENRTFSRFSYSTYRETRLRKAPGGGSRIRTREGLRLSGFQDHRHRPLGHPSGVSMIPVAMRRKPYSGRQLRTGRSAPCKVRNSLTTGPG